MYNMTREDNIFYAKRNLVDTIWKEAHIEGISVTYPDTQEIVEGRSVAGLSIDDVLTINNLKHAWRFVLDSLDVPLDLDYIKSVNYKVGEGGVVRFAGDLREKVVTVGGTSWIPFLPEEEKVVADLNVLNQIQDGLQRALETFAYICRAQMFNDGNKRTAQLIANKLLIESGNGILAIPIQEKATFGNRLIEFYESGDPSRLIEFLKSRCLDGFDSPDFDKQSEKEKYSLREVASDAKIVSENQRIISEFSRVENRGR